MDLNKKIRVFVVDDSMVFRNFLIKSIGQSPRFEVIGHAINAFDAERQIPQLKPDVVTLDIEMPGMSGLDFLKKFLPKYPVPVILVSSLNLRVFDALEVGAVDFVRKPDVNDEITAKQFVSNLLPKLLIASNSRVRMPRGTVSSTPTTTAEARHLQTPTPRAMEHFAGENKIVAIGASTGGTEAILDVVRNFPANMPGVVITQHMPAGFTAMYAERLNKILKMEVREAKNGDKVHQGLMLIAPGGYQMRLVKRGMEYFVSCTIEEKVNGHAPSVDVLFNSVAQNARDQAIGVILTGMGSDGAAGLLRMRKNGAFTIGQDKDTCVVYGMPMVAHNIGAVCQQAPLLTIPSIIYRQLGLLAK